MAATALPNLVDSNFDRARDRTTDTGIKWLRDASELTISDDKSREQGKFYYELLRGAFFKVGGEREERRQSNSVTTVFSVNEMTRC